MQPDCREEDPGLELIKLEIRMIAKIPYLRYVDEE